MRSRVVLLAGLLIAAPAVAQIDYIGIQAASIQNSNMMDKLYDRRDNPGGSTRRPVASPNVARSTYAGAGRSQYFSRPARADVVPISFAYRSTPNLRREVAQGYIERTTQSDPQAGRLIAAEIAKHDFSKIYAGIVAPFGYRANDTADALAAYTLLGWLIATGAPDPDAAAARAVRSQVAQGLANDPRFADPRKRAELAEEMKLLFVTLHSGWQSARREGNLKSYSDGVASMFKRFSGNDLRSMRLTDQGFVRG